jgi:hypothetical protein
MDSLLLAVDRSAEDGGTRLMHRWLPLPDGRGSENNARRSEQQSRGAGQRGKELGDSA